MKGRVNDWANERLGQCMNRLMNELFEGRIGGEVKKDI